MLREQRGAIQEPRCSRVALPVSLAHSVLLVRRHMTLMLTFLWDSQYLLPDVRI